MPSFFFFQLMQTNVASVKPNCTSVETDNVCHDSFTYHFHGYQQHEYVSKISTLNSFQIFLEVAVNKLSCTHRLSEMKLSIQFKRYTFKWFTVNTIIG